MNGNSGISKNQRKDDNRGGDRRIASDPKFSGPDRRKGERRKEDRRIIGGD